MEDTQKGINLLFQHIIGLDMMAHELEVARRIVTEGTSPLLQYYKEQIPSLETNVIEQYKRIWSNLQNVVGAESGIARIAMRAIMQNCGLENI